MKAGQTDAALGSLRQADARDQGRLRTRLWLIRAMIEAEFLNDALDMTDLLAGAGHEGPAMDYLYGMSFAFKARKYVREGVNLGTVRMHYGDAVTFLESATKADPDRFGDAFLFLADAAWNTQDLPRARAAAESARGKEPRNILATLMLGEVAFSQFVAARGKPDTQAAADGHWQVALDSFEAATRMATPSSAALARGHSKAGDALVWKGELERASGHYAAALGHDPGALNLGQVLSSLGADLFLECLESGAQKTASGARDASLRWWLGWSRFTHQSYPEAQGAFEAAFAQNPSFTNCKWYLGLIAFHGQEFETAAALIAENFDLSAEDLASSINSKAGLHGPIVEHLIGVSAKAGRNLVAGKLSEALAVAAPETSRFWNNAGLFYRDTGASRKIRRNGDEAAKQARSALYERALLCYEKALDLEPENANYLNDTAVVLHYNLKRDLERAGDLYQRSLEMAERELARDDLDQETERVLKIARRDSLGNLKKLKRELARDAE